MDPDFIVVGAGPAGCVLARLLALAPKRPRVLLLEAGPPSDSDSDSSPNPAKRMPASRTTTFTLPGMSWPYISEPNPHQDARCLPLPRGKGLGGSSAINFAIWTEGCREDWDRMADLMGDDAWKWERVKQRFNTLTTHHCKQPDVRPEMKRFVSQSEGGYGTEGPLHIGYAEEPEQEVLGLVDVLESAGVRYRAEANTGVLEGAFIHPDTFWRATRSTAADLLHPLPLAGCNLDVLTDTPIARVLFEEDRAIGVEAVDGRVFHCAKGGEVILSAGTMDSPKILMHSGIGPADQLSNLDIPVLRNNPNVGSHFQDHLFAALAFRGHEHLSRRPSFFRDPQARAAALRAWLLHRTGPYASINSTIPTSFHRPASLLQSPEFAALPDPQREFLSKPAVPLYELGADCISPLYFTHPESAPAIFSVFVIPQNLQSRGRFTLRSADPGEPLAFWTGYMEHPFDRRCVIEATRDVMALLKQGDFPRYMDGVLDAPASDGDEDILSFWRRSGGTGFHGVGTCRMGLGLGEEEDEAVVGGDFGVHGVRGLRVVDNSVWPAVPSGHIQAHAYQIGMIAAEKLIAEHALNRQQNGNTNHDHHNGSTSYCQ